MKPDELVAHCLNILEGHTGLIFPEGSIQKNSDVEVWTSTPVPVPFGPMSFTANTVRVQISYNVMGDLVHQLSDGLSYATIVLVFTGDPLVTTTARRLSFRNGFFYRYE